MSIGETSNREPPSKRKEELDGQNRKPKPHEMGLQVPRRVYPHLTRTYSERKRNFAGQSFWARGYFVSTVGRDEEVMRNYIRHQEQEDERLEQLGLWR